MHFSGLWEEAGVPEKTHTDTGRTCEHRTGRPVESNPGPWCEATLLPLHISIG